MRVLVSATLSVVMVAGLAAAPRQAAAAAKPPTAQQDWVTPSRIIPANGGAQPRQAAGGPAAPVWPKAGEQQIALPWATPTAARDTPVSVAARDGSPPVAKVRVRVYDRAATEAARVRGVLVGVSRADAQTGAGTVEVTLSYRDFAAAYGADWATRLRLLRLPLCALRTPDRAECRGTPLATVHDATAATLTASVDLTSLEVLLAAQAGVSGGAGDYSATSLQPSATWTAASSTGEFVWNYPLRTPPSPGGTAPKLDLAYSSGSVDGRMAASNNQPSWAGEGFELWSGFIERRYVSCGDDLANGANNTSTTGDLCWVTDNATVSLAGHAGELIKDASTPDRWHLRGEDGSYIQRRTGAGNGRRRRMVDRADHRRYSVLVRRS